MTPTDPTLGVAAFLNTELKAVTGSIEEGLRVFRPQLPIEEEKKMPRKCIVVTPAGGGHMFGRTTLPVMDDVVDVTCFGSSRLEAENLAREAMTALYGLKRSKWEGVPMFWARIAAGPVSQVDKTTNWPEALLVVQVMHQLEI